MTNPISVLLVEDNPGDVVLLRAALRKARVDLDLVVAGNGERALEILRDGSAPQVDLALFDINLPGMSGIELLEIVKSDPDMKQLPVIMLTSSDSSQDIRNSYAAHANCYLTKPVDVSALMEIVQKLDDFWLNGAHLPSRQ